MTSANYTNDAQQRLLKVVRTLAGHEVVGLTNAQIATDVGCSASMAVRDLANLKEAGWAEQVRDTGRWRLAPTIVQIAVAHMTAMDAAQTKLDETRNRFSRG